MIRLPKEGGSSSALLLVSLYGTREAANAWAEEIKVTMEEAGFIQGLSFPFVLMHESKDLRVVVHGDYFVVLGPWRAIRWLRGVLKDKLEITFRGAMGLILGADGLKSVKLLGRIIALHRDGYTWEGDPQHAATIAKRVGVEGGHGV